MVGTWYRRGFQVLIHAKIMRRMAHFHSGWLLGYWRTFLSLSLKYALVNIIEQMEILIVAFKLYLKA